LSKYEDHNKTIDDSVLKVDMKAFLRKLKLYPKDLLEEFIEAFEFESLNTQQHFSIPTKLLIDPKSFKTFKKSDKSNYSKG